MPKPWLIIDANFFCHRAHNSAVYSVLKRSGDRDTRILYVFLRDLLSLHRLFDTNKTIICFDHGQSKREEIYPDYKKPRRLRQKRLLLMSQNDQKEFYSQIEALKTQQLSELGFRNVFYEDGYEADDLIASLCLHKRPGTEYIVISSDQDLFQLLRTNISIYSPTKKETTTLTKFRKRYGIEPEQWPTVKAISGCRTDNIDGVLGVGEVTALSYLHGTLSKESKKYKDIVSNYEVLQTNMKLVKLPMEGTPKLYPRRDEITQQDWKQSMDRLGFQTLRNWI